MKDYFRPYIVFAMAAFLMLGLGGIFQVLLPLQLGLILTEVACVLGIAVFYRKVEDREITWPSLRTWDQPIGTMVLIVVAAILIGLVANVTAAITVELVPSLQGREEAYAETIEALLRPPEWYWAVAGVLAVTVFAPFCEEFLFRGTLFPTQQLTEPPAMAIVANGILFGAIHFNAMALVSLTIFGIFLAHITYYSRSLWPAIVAHAAMNLANGVLLPLIALDFADPNLDPGLEELLVSFGLVTPVAGGVWIWVVRRMSRTAQL